MRGERGGERAHGHLGIAVREPLQGARQIGVAGLRVAHEEGERGAVPGAVGGAGQQGERGVAQQGAIGVGGDVRGDPQRVGDGGRAAGGALVVGPAVDGAAQRGRLLVGEHGEEFVGVRVRAVGEGLGEVVDGAVPVRVEERLGRGGDGRVGQGGQRPRVVEPTGEVDLDSRPGPR